MSVVELLDFLEDEIELHCGQHLLAAALGGDDGAVIVLLGVGDPSLQRGGLHALLLSRVEDAQERFAGALRRRSLVVRLDDFIALGVGPRRARLLGVLLLLLLDEAVDGDVESRRERFGG